MSHNSRLYIVYEPNEIHRREIVLLKRLLVHRTTVSHNSCLYIVYQPNEIHRGEIILLKPFRFTELLKQSIDDRVKNLVIVT